jgi:hypothetical protein
MPVWGGRRAGFQRIQDRLRLKGERIVFAVHNKIFVFQHGEMFMPEAFAPNIRG